MSEEEELIITVRGGVGGILLNRPKKLNCLTIGMIRKMRSHLEAWGQKDSGVKVVVVRGSGRAFCSGGDVVSLYHGDAKLRAEYISEEYALDLQVSKLPIPYISVLDGITMGGGCGISVNGRYRVSTKRTVMAMPECAIGLVPDVGAGAFLGKLEGHLGLFMGLTGHRMEGRDCLSAGLATHYFSSKEGWERLDKLEEELEKVTQGEGSVTSEVPAVLGRMFETKKSRLSIHSYLEMIDNVFSLTTLGDILEGLEALGWQAGEEGEVPRFARDSLTRMKTFSPTSLRLTFQHLKDRPERMTLKESLAAEQRMQTRCLAAPDFKEGIRTTLLEKEKGLKASWSPASLKQVTDVHLAPYLRPLQHHTNLALEQGEGQEKVDQEAEAAWAGVLGMRLGEYLMAKEGRVSEQIY